MGILNMPYINNTLGIDLINETRPYIYFTADDRIGVIDNEYFLIIKNDLSKALYKYHLKDRTDYSKIDTIRTNEMRDYVFSHLQAAQWMIDNDK